MQGLALRLPHLAASQAALEAAEAGVKKSSAVSWTMRKVRSTAERSDTPFFVDADCNPNDEECHYAH